MSNASDSQGIREAAAEATRAFMTCTSRVGKTTRLLALSTELVIYLFESTGHWPATESVYTAIEHADRNLCTASIRSSAERSGSPIVHVLLVPSVNMPICCSRISKDPAEAFHNSARSTDSPSSGRSISLSIRSHVQVELRRAE